MTTSSTSGSALMLHCIRPSGFYGFLFSCTVSYIPHATDPLLHKGIRYEKSVSLVNFPRPALVPPRPLREQCLFYYSHYTKSSTRLYSITKNLSYLAYLVTYIGLHTHNFGQLDEAKVRYRIMHILLPYLGDTSMQVALIYDYIKSGVHLVNCSKRAYSRYLLGRYPKNCNNRTTC